MIPTYTEKGVSAMKLRFTALTGRVSPAAATASRSTAKYPGGLRLAAGRDEVDNTTLPFPPRQHRRGAGDPRPHRPLRPHPHAHQKRLPGPHHHHPAHGEPAGHHAPGLRPTSRSRTRSIRTARTSGRAAPGGAALHHRGRCSAGAGVCADLRIWPNGADHR